ncbi:MAG: AraC family transcriptional regulator [Candidatus Marinimicrobia bacterium]|nr:AraC family transcriptional regulator [Candidatus Neomarinimicrobiota bacterium]
MPFKKDGFQGERSIVIPQQVRREHEQNHFSKGLYITDIGYYPKAKYHFRQRKTGCNQYILIYCTEGSGWYKFNQKKYEVKAGHYFILPKDLPHQYGAREDDPWTIYWCHFNGTTAEEQYAKFSNNGQNHPVSVNFISDRLNIFFEIFSTLEMGYSNNNLLYADLCFSHLLFSFLLPVQFSKCRLNDIPNEIEASILYMKNNLYKKFTLKNFADHAQHSITHYSKLFKEKTGWSPISYFNHLKMQYACQLLDTTSFRIKEISQKLGFDDTYYFSRLFKKIMGNSPRYYRNQQKG